MELGKYSFGIGDRFGHQGKAQLKAVLKARNLGVELVPVWNKSNREHQIIGTEPKAVRIEADQAVSDLGYVGKYFVDADHINGETVDSFLSVSDFFTLDVASFIGKPGSKNGYEKAVETLSKLGEKVKISGLEKPIELDDLKITAFLGMYLGAIESAVSLYTYIKEKKGGADFIAEVSMDEVETAQTPDDLLLILSLLASYGIPVQTIAPKFSGRFNKGVDYVGDKDLFREEFEADLCVIKYAIEEFSLPADLKLSIHSGSDKFTIYPIMGELIRKHDTGIHVKTAGTTWLEEVIGLALGDDESLKMVKDIYREALTRKNELCDPYADVIDIKEEQLPDSIADWSGAKVANALRHIPGHEEYNASFRQLFHVGYKLAAERGEDFLGALRANEEIISQQVEDNLYDRHILRLFDK